jgi:DNA-binding NarL/FixJ family response regulator
MPQSASPSPIRVLVVDDHPAVRDAVRDTIQRYDDVAVCSESATAADALTAIERDAPDVAIVDLSLGDAHGLDLTKQIASRFPEVRVVIFSMYDEFVYAERAIEAGAQGYVMKTEPVERLVDALRKAVAGDIYVSQTLTAQILHRLTGTGESTPRPLDRLTDRELEVFQLIGEGYSIEEIQEKLRVSRSAVDKYRRQAMRKLDCDSVRDLLRRAVTWFHEAGTSATEKAPT